MRSIIIVFMLSIYFVSCSAQTVIEKTENTNTVTRLNRPKLVVGIVVDQMRYDYLTRYYDKYSERGFKRLMNNGFHAKNTHFNYIPTYTAVGHTSLYTGTTPDHHGIISNNWYDKYLKKSIYCVDDEKYESVGSTNDEGKKSPYRMKVTTVIDELHLHQNLKGKMIGIAIKDRSAILPVGHTADGAYWLDSDSGHWITSSFYMDRLPQWVDQFNQQNKVDAYLSKPWETLYDINTYTESMDDNNVFEGLFKGEEAPVFPHDLPKLKVKNGKGLIKTTPFGNSLTADFAKAAIVAEGMGKDDITDFLAISFSSTDYVGHMYGVDAKETEDTYLRLDNDLADFLDFLDKQVGNDNYTVFLTADHGAVQVPSYLQSLAIPGGYFKAKELKEHIQRFVVEQFNTKDILENISNYQIYLNKNEIKKQNLNVQKVAQLLADEIIDFEGVYKVVTAETLQSTTFTRGVLSLLQRGYNQKYSGDVFIVPMPSMITSDYHTGTTHGSGFNYDTQVPLLFYGNGIKKGISTRYIPITSIAPTVASLLNISFPNANLGDVIPEALEQKKD